MDQLFQVVGILTSIIIGLWIIFRLLFGEKWKRKVTTTLFLGQGLLNASKKLANELPSNVKKETLAEVGTHAFLRFTRLGIIGIMIAIFPIWLLIKQNEKFDIQNEQLNLQNNLIEAGRRGSLIILMSNILDQMNEEINEQKRDTSFVDSLGYALSDPLIGRIAALSQGFLPYRYLENGALTEKPSSPERGQLLLSLVKSGLGSITYNEIYQATNFSNAYLDGANLIGANLSGVKLTGVKLSGANLSGANLSGAKLSGANLSGANLSGANLSGANLSGANLSEANLMGVDLSEARLWSADLRKADLRKAELRKTDLMGADLSRAKLMEAELSEAKLWSASLSRVRNLNIDQLKKVKTLYFCKKLDPELRQQLEKEKSCLFTEQGCE